jgi:uncharacterized membrane protein
MCYIGQLAGELFRASRYSDSLPDRYVLVLILMIMMVVVVVMVMIILWRVLCSDRETNRFPQLRVHAKQ